MRGSSGDQIRLNHILDAIQEIQAYLVESDFSIFKANSMMRFACIKQLEIIGEASNHISNEIKLKFNSIKWSQIIGVRNIFEHEYFGVDSDVVWEIIQSDLPELKEQVKSILTSFQ